MMLKLKEKIGIVIVIILLIILVITLWSGQKNNNRKVTINCDTACIKMGNRGWTFLGVAPTSQNIFSTKEACVSFCRAKLKK